MALLRTGALIVSRPGALICLLLTCGANIALADTLLVVRKSADSLDFIDPGSGLRLGSVAVGHAPHEISVAPDGTLAAVTNYGTREEPGHTLSIVDLQQPREVRRIELAAHTRPHGVSWYRSDRIAVTTEGSGDLLLVDARSGRIVASHATSQRTSHMVAVAHDAAQAFVANIGSGSVSVISLFETSPAGVAAAPASPAAPVTIDTGAGTEGIAVTPDGREVWATAREAGHVTILDANTHVELARLPLPGTPIRIAFAPDGATAYVTCASTSDIVAFDVAARRQTQRTTLDLPRISDPRRRPPVPLAPGGALPVGLVVSPDGRSIFVAATMTDRVVQLDARTLQVMRIIDVGGEPDGMGMTRFMPRSECHACAPAAPQNAD